MDALLSARVAAAYREESAMSNTARTWKDALGSRLPEAIAEEIDQYENQMELRKQGKLGEKVFAELRLRRGAYGQRYDNGHRYDGSKT